MGETRARMRRAVRQSPLNESHPFSWVRRRPWSGQINRSSALNESHLFLQVRPHSQVTGNRVNVHPSMKVTHSHG